MRTRSGFTLIEVLVALTLAAIVATMARALFGSVLDAAARTTEARERLDRWANGRRLLGSMVGSMEAGSDSTASFSGQAHAMVFTTWLLDSLGRPARTRVTLSVQEGRLAVGGLDSRPLALADSVTAAEFDYLLRLGSDAPWARSFVSRLSAPLAVRLRLYRSAAVDTLLLIVGERG